MSWCSEYADKVADAVEGVLPGGGEDARDHAVGFGAGPGLVASAGLARDHRRPKRPLGAIVGGIDSIVREEGKQMRPLPDGEPGAYLLKTGPDGRLYLGSGTGNLFRYDPRADAFETLVKGQMAGITWGGCVTDRHVVWSANPGQACVYDWRENRLLHVIKPLDVETPSALYGHNAVECPDGKVPAPLLLLKTGGVDHEGKGMFIL